MVVRALLFIGLAGSGKSSVSRSVARRYGAAYLDKDTLGTGYIRLLLEQRNENGNERENNEFYQQVIFPVEYATVMAAAADNLRLGNNVVIDAPFSRYLEHDDWLRQAVAAAEWPECEIIVVHVTASEAVIRSRVAARGNVRDEWKLANWDQFWAMMSESRCRWRGAVHLNVPNDGPEP